MYNVATVPFFSTNIIDVNINLGVGVRLMIAICQNYSNARCVLVPRIFTKGNNASVFIFSTPDTHSCRGC